MVVPVLIAVGSEPAESWRSVLQFATENRVHSRQAPLQVAKFQMTYDMCLLPSVRITLSEPTTNSKGMSCHDVVRYAFVGE